MLSKIFHIRGIESENMSRSLKTKRTIPFDYISTREKSNVIYTDLKGEDKNLNFIMKCFLKMFQRKNRQNCRSMLL